MQPTNSKCFHLVKSQVTSGNMYSKLRLTNPLFKRNTGRYINHTPRPPACRRRLRKCSCHRQLHVDRENLYEKVSRADASSSLPTPLQIPCFMIAGGPNHLPEQNSIQVHPSQTKGDLRVSYYSSQSTATADSFKVGTSQGRTTPTITNRHTIYSARAEQNRLGFSKAGKRFHNQKISQHDTQPNYLGKCPRSCSSGGHQPPDEE